MKSHSKQAIAASCGDMNGKAFLTRYEAATYLSVCPSVLDRLDIPRIKVGRGVRYRRNILDNWLLEKEFSNGHKENGGAL